MKREEKVMAVWPPELRDDAQPLEELPLIGSTDYIIVRFQGEKNRTYMRRTAEFMQSMIQENDPDIHMSYTSVDQRPSRWQPNNSWAVVRGAFDWLMSYGRQVRREDETQVRAKQAQRDNRRRERAAQ